MRKDIRSQGHYGARTLRRKDIPRKDIWVQKRKSASCANIFVLRKWHWLISILVNFWKSSFEKGFFSSFPIFNVQLSLKAQPLNQWFSTCGPWSTDRQQKYFAVGHRAFWFKNVVFARWAVYWFGLNACRKLRWMASWLFFFWRGKGEITCFWPEKPFEFWWRSFCLEITWF